MAKMNVIGCMLLACLTLGSCVSNKKYLGAKSRISRLQSDSMRLAKSLADRENQLQQTSDQLNATEADKQRTASQLNMTKEQVAEQQRRLQQLQALIDQQRKNTEALRKKMSDALVNFNSEQLSVFIKNGKVYVSMQESLLFPSGSAVVNPKGKEALATLAQVLNQNPDINVLVEGHTDSIPISKKYEDNWALSVARSTAISRVMIKDYGVAPARITASGRSQYEPVESNTTPEGRAKNRRTEIILAPKLDELMKLIEGN